MANGMEPKEAIPMHKRIAMGEALDGSSLASKGGSVPQSTSKQGSGSGALSKANKK